MAVRRERFRRTLAEHPGVFLREPRQVAEANGRGHFLHRDARLSGRELPARRGQPQRAQVGDRPQVVDALEGVLQRPPGTAQLVAQVGDRQRFAQPLEHRDAGAPGDARVAVDPQLLAAGLAALPGCSRTAFVVVRPDGSLFGTNTDAYGYIQNIRQLQPGWRPDAGPVVVIGAGGLGHIGIQVLRAMCAARIIVVDISDRSLELAAQGGADHLVKADGGEARRAGADYVAFGAMFASTTKPAAPVADPARFAEVADLGIARCAIGGITLARAPALIEAGADLLAVVSDLFDATDISARARAYAQLF